MKEETIFIPSTGIQLEGLLGIREPLSTKGGIVLCHPHPQYGGDMHNVVISTAAKAADQEGFLTLRFNFRGVGRSGGSYGEGMGEKEDVRAAIAYLFSIFANSALPVVLMGYSFGAWVAVPVALEDDRVKGMIVIAPPLELYDFSGFEENKKPKLVIVGTRDAFCPPPLLDEWFRRLKEPKRLARIEGADHFFFYHHHLLMDPLRSFLNIL